MDNFNALRAAIEGIGESQAQTDAFQAGVLASTDWALSGEAINSGTAALSYSSAGGAAWLPAPVSALVRTFTTPAVLSGLLPPVLPGAGAYMKVGIELTASGSSAALSVASGVEKGSEAEAIAAPPPTTSGKMRIHDTVIKNTAGVYSVMAPRDRRPWAKGAYAYATLPTTKETASATFVAIDTTNLSLRLECSGVPLRIFLVGNFEKGGGATPNIVGLGYLLDGTAAAPQLDEEFNPGSRHELTFDTTIAPSAGSHLFRAAFLTGGGTLKMIGGAEANGLFLVREELRPNANNGTA